LSTTAKVKARTDRKIKAEGGDVEMSEVPDAKEEKKEDEAATEAKKEEKPEPEADFLILKNPTRILKAQEKKIVYS
jgi:hypothetical protein